MDKYTIPSLPTTQHILDDLADPTTIQLDELRNTSCSEDEILQNVSLCYKNFKQLEEDLLKQQELNMKLEELNRKLVENIDNMKKQT